MTDEKNTDPFENFANPTQEDIDVALKTLPIRIITNKFGGWNITYKGLDSNGKPFIVVTISMVTESEYGRF